MKRTKISKKEYEKIIEEATVDCYNEDEAFYGMVCTLSDELNFLMDSYQKRFLLCRF